MIKGIRHNTPSKLASNGVFDVRHGLFSAMGVLLALDPPTKGMLSEAASAGRFQLTGLTKTNPIVGEGLVATRGVGSNGNEREGTSPSPTPNQAGAGIMISPCKFKQRKKVAE